MDSMCPKCHQPVDHDSICCADIKFTWKCKSCDNLTTGFVFPYGRCSLCGGENELVEGYTGARGDLVPIVQEAVQLKSTCTTSTEWPLKRRRRVLQSVLEDLRDKEQIHLQELEERYHLHLARFASIVRQGREDFIRICLSWNRFQGR